MNRKRLGYILIGAGFVVGAGIAFFVYSALLEAEELRLKQPKAQVVIAKLPIEERTEISASQLDVLKVPDDAVPEGTATRIDDNVVGKFTPAPIKKGEMINLQKIGPLSARNAPSFQIEKGKVMYVMPLQLPNQAPFTMLQVNALRPGDRIDFIYSAFTVPAGVSEQEVEAAVRRQGANFLQTRFMLQSLRVQQIGRFDATGKIVPDPTHMILVVTPEEALVLKWLKDASQYFGNSIEMVLRTPADEEKVDPSLTVNLSYMREKYGLPEPPRVVSGAR